MTSEKGDKRPKEMLRLEEAEDSVVFPKETKTKIQDNLEKMYDDDNCSLEEMISYIDDEIDAAAMRACKALRTMAENTIEMRNEIALGDSEKAKATVERIDKFFALLCKELQCPTH